MTSCRMVSSSTPMASMSSGVRWATGLSGFFCRTVIRLLVSGRWGRSVVDVAGAGGGADAGLHEDAVPGRGGGQLAVAEVPDAALTQRQPAAVADAHPAAAGHEQPALLGGVQDRGGAVELEASPGPRESH